MKALKGILSGLVALALLLLPLEQPTARGMHGGGAAAGGGGGTLITTMTVVNTSGSTQATDFVTSIFGHPFKKGDIVSGCSGGAPKFELTGGTNIPFSEGTAPVCWSDGSLKWAPFMLRVPTSIAGSGSITINIKSGGTTPSASGRALSDFALSSTDLNVSVTGMDNLTGVWVSNLNQGVGAANTDNYVYMDGDAGKVWRVRASFRQSSADHGQLEGYWFVQALQANGGGLYGLRALVKIAQPWYNIDAPAKAWRSFSAWTFNNSATPIRDFMTIGYFGASAAKSFTWTTSGDPRDITATANGFSQGPAMRLTTTGSLPAGLNTGQTYFINNPQTNTFQAATLSVGASSSVTPTTNCTGTCTATPYPFITHFGGLFTAGSSGKPDYIQGGGSVAADDTTRFQFNTLYWRSTQMLPPYLLETVTPGTQTPYTFWPMTHGPAVSFMGTTGPRDDIAYEAGWYVRHFFRQDANGEQTARTMGLVGGITPFNMRSKTTFTIPVVNNGPNGSGSYASMPTPAPTFQSCANPSECGTTGFTPPADTNVLQAVFYGTTFDHMPEFPYYPALTFGEPQYQDSLLDFYNQAMIARTSVVTGVSATVNGASNGIAGPTGGGPSTRNSTVNGTAYYGTNWCTTSGMRCQGWTMRSMGVAAAIGGGYGPGGASTRTYMLDTIKDTYAANMAYIGMLPAFAQNNGLWLESNGINTSSWQQSFILGSTAYAAATNELSTNIINFVTHLGKLYTFVDSNFSTWAIGWYTGNGRTGVNSSPAGNDYTNPYITSAALWGIGGPFSGQIGVSWTNGSPTMTVTFGAGSPAYTPANNDNMFTMGQGGTYPGGMADFTPYYMCAVSGATFQLTTATACGGSTFTPNNTGSSFDLSYGPIGHPSSGGVGGTDAQGNVTYVFAALSWGGAVGGTINATTLSHVTAVIAADATHISSLNASPGFAIGGSY